MTLKKELKKSSEEKNSKSKLVQDLLPFLCVDRGCIINKDGSIVKILEIESCDYNNSPLVIRNTILQNFCNLFECSCENIHIKSVIKNQDTTKLVGNIKDRNNSEENKFYNERREDYENLINTISQDVSIKRTYYLIFSLDNQKTQKNRDIEIEKMMDKIREFSSIVENMKCTIVPESITSNDYVYETLYELLNPLSSKTETIQDRFKRISSDFVSWNLINENELKEPTLNDVVSCKGIDFTCRTDAFIQDGLWTTYLIVKGNSYAEMMYNGLLQEITSNFAIDYDIFSIRRNTEDIINEMKSSERNRHIASNSKDETSTDTTKMEDTYGYYSTLNEIRRCLKYKQHFFDVVLVFTFRALTIKDLIRTKNDFISKYSRSPYSLSFRECYCNLKEMFLLSLPTTDFSSSSPLFKLNKRGMVTSSFRMLMPFNNREFCDNDGIVMGQNVNTGGLLSVNFFNRNMGFQNANIAILGGSGSGKTFAEMMFSSRMYLTGHKTLYVCPLKGHEYQWVALSSNGTFVNLIPSGDCLNPFDISNETVLDDDFSSKKSIVAKKITQLLTFLTLVFPNISIEEEGQLNTALVKIYNKKGIDEKNNKSIFNNDGTKKEMPTFSDLYEEIKDNEVLISVSRNIKAYFIDGTWNNLNGHTNVDMSKSCIVINCDEDAIGKKMLPSIMYLGYISLYDIVKSDGESEDMLIVDECWKFLVNNSNAEHSTGEQLLECAKIIRGFKGGLVVSTQDINDFLNNQYGEPILNNCNTKILKYLEGNQSDANSNVCRVISACGLPYSEYAPLVGSFQPCHALLITPKQQAILDLISSYSEKVIFGTDKVTTFARNWLSENKGWGKTTFKVSEDDVKEMIALGVVDEGWANA